MYPLKSFSSLKSNEDKELIVGDIKLSSSYDATQILINEDLPEFIQVKERMAMCHCFYGIEVQRTNRHDNRAAKGKISGEYEAKTPIAINISRLEHMDNNSNPVKRCLLAILSSVNYA
nr:uncharacterized protein LOC109190185 [Ipomoea batatas]